MRRKPVYNARPQIIRYAYLVSFKLCEDFLSVDRQRNRHDDLSSCGVCVSDESAMDSFDSLLAIPLLLSDSESSNSMWTSDNEEPEADVVDNVNNEDDQVHVGCDIDDDEGDDGGEEVVIYAEEVAVNSTDGSPLRYNTSADTAAAATAPLQTSGQLPIALPYTAPPAPPPPSSSAAKSSRFVPASSATAAAAAAAAKSPPTPVIVTATPLPLLGPLRPPMAEYEPAASVAASRLSAQYTDWLRRRAETLMQKRLRTQVRATFPLACCHAFLVHARTGTVYVCHTVCSGITSPVQPRISKRTTV